MWVVIEIIPDHCHSIYLEEVSHLFFFIFSYGANLVQRSAAVRAILI